MAHTQVTVQPDSWTEVAAAADVVEMMQTHTPTGVRYISQTDDPTSATNSSQGMLLERGDSVVNWTLASKLWARSGSIADVAKLTINIL